MNNELLGSAPVLGRSNGELARRGWNYPGRVAWFAAPETGALRFVASKRQLVRGILSSWERARVRALVPTNSPAHFASLNPGTRPKSRTSALTSSEINSISAIAA